ncbi:hypothetical protein I3842_11G166200 [Carya illinoinensis]|uniref:RING-type domain-containing protein n=1 Tax=Carya illinoinensis TaxID=32201 RepID=A0A922DRZ0_CARIL|nr:hypothetical protein I3842_11G166200 [Carya illinoinensis]
MIFKLFFPHHLIFLVLSPASIRLIKPRSACWFPVSHEAGDTINRTWIDPASSQQDAESPAPVRNVTLLQILLVEVLDRRTVESEEVQGQRQNLRNLDLLPPAINYRRQDITSSHSECAICLEEFIDGESCRVFHACKHLFHSACIDKWLRLNPSCPICRNFVIDV